MLSKLMELKWVGDWFKEIGFNLKIVKPKGHYLI